ncbi:MAG TPA: hypothetical protein VIV40_07445 [Kofleriaceae bacterium]
MTAHDDDGDNDPQLKSLRAVWLSMPDEDPPERGLTELMAAARVKAEQMTTPSLWQRLVALLRRPPMLALATVMVLLGGAVLIGTRRAKLEAPPPQVTQERAASDQTVPSTAGAGSAALAAPGAAATEIPPATPAEAPVAEPAHDPAMIAEPKLDYATPAHKPARKPAPKTSGAKVTRGATSSLDKESKAERARDGLNFEAGLAGQSGAKLDDKQATSGDSFAPEATVTEAPKDVKVGAASSPRADTAPPPVQPNADVAKAKVAAARGDCATARTLMKRVAGEDPNAYRKALATDATLNKCFVAAQ